MHKSACSACKSDYWLPISTPESLLNIAKWRKLGWVKTRGVLNTGACFLVQYRQLLHTYNVVHLSLTVKGGATNLKSGVNALEV